MSNTSRGPRGIRHTPPDHSTARSPAHLVAAAVGDDRCRGLAWDALWGTIHHQGTVYSATVAAVPIVTALARWEVYPNRSMALV